jgi:hypothetical protein
MQSSKALKILDYHVEQLNSSDMHQTNHLLPILHVSQESCVLLKFIMAL